jgi:cytochrome c oxidase subunit 2
MNFPVVPHQASSISAHYDAIFYALVALTLFFSVLVGVLVIVFAVRYRAGNKVDRSNPAHESRTLELTWSVIPLVLGLIMFYFGAQLFVDMKNPPPNSMEIFVIGKQWMWHAQHTNGVRENNTLHVPVGRPVKLTMISQDVIHAMYIPDFRVQYHVVPGRYTTLWFTPTRPGKYPLFCAMYCGTQHSEMGGYVYAMPPEEFAEWLANGGENRQRMTVEQQGAKLFSSIGCGNCHGPTDTLRAPSLYSIVGKRREFTDGSSVIADQSYLRESILNPWNRITKGYENTMPSYVGQIDEEDVLKLTAYIRSLGSAAPAQPSVDASPLPGLQETNRFVPDRPRLSVGAIGAREPLEPGPKEGNLSAGAMSMQGKTSE